MAALFTIVSTLFEAVIKILIELTKLCFGFARKGSDTLFTNRNRPMDAKFAPSSRILYRRGDGFCLDGTASLSRKDSFRNAMIVGGSGAGKSVTVILPTLLRVDNCSLIIHDPSGELQIAVPALIKKGYRVKIVNYANPHVSDLYNPLAYVNSPADAGQIAHILVSSGLGKSTDQFWNQAAESLITTLICITLTQAPQYRNLANVARLINLLGSKPEKVDALFAKCANQHLYEEYAAFLSQPEKLAGNILATAKTALAVFSQESVGLVTSADTLDFGSLRKHKTAIFIQNSVMSTEFFAPLTSTFMYQLFAHLLGPLPSEDDLDVLCIIDECSSFKAQWSLILANCRKWRVGCLLALQERQQLEELYGMHGAQSIESNCFARLYFTNPSLKTARDLSELLGKFEFENDKGQKQIRSLMTPQELKQMPINTALLLAGHHPPMLCTMKPYFETALRKHIATAMPQRESRLPWTTVPMLPLL